MRASSMRYLMGNGFRNLWHNRLMTIASVGTLVACLLIVGVAVLFSLNVDNMVEYVGEQNELVVFMNVGTSDEQLAQMESQLNRLDGLGEITYVSSDEAIDQIVDQYLDGVPKIFRLFLNRCYNIPVNFCVFNIVSQILCK